MENTLLTRRQIGLGSVVLAIAIIPIFVLSYSPYYTHPDLTEQMVRLFNNDVLVGNTAITDEQIRWLRAGAIEEDEPPRWINHFYDPVHGVGWGGKHEGAMAPADAVLEAATMAPLSPMASITWATNQEAQSVYRQYGNQTWQKAIASYVNGDQTSAFIALGHILHLIEDASVPDHTRGDTHSHLHGDPGSPFEDFAEQYTNTHALQYANTLAGQPIPAYQSIYEAFKDIANYSNSHFFSEDTINNAEFSNPAMSSLKNDGDYLFDSVDKVYLALFERKGGENFYTTNDQEKVLPSYRDHLFPRVILTGVGVIKLFFAEVQKYQTFQQQLESVVADRPTSWIESFFQSPLGALKLPFVTAKQNIYDKTVSDITIAVAAQKVYRVSVVPILTGSVPMFRIVTGLFNPSTGNLLQPLSNAVVTAGAVQKLTQLLNNTPVAQFFGSVSPMGGVVSAYYYPSDAMSGSLDPFMTQLNSLLAPPATTTAPAVITAADLSLWGNIADALATAAQTTKGKIANVVAASQPVVSSSIVDINKTIVQAAAPPAFMQTLPYANPDSTGQYQVNVCYIAQHLLDNHMYQFEDAIRTVWDHNLAYKQGGMFYPVYDYDGRYGTPYQLNFLRGDINCGRTMFVTPEEGFFLGTERIYYNPILRQERFYDMSAVPDGYILYTPAVAVAVDATTPRLIGGKLYTAAQAETIYAAQRSGSTANILTAPPPATVLPSKQSTWWDAVTNVWHTVYNAVASAITWVVSVVVPVIKTIINAVASAAVAVYHAVSSAVQTAATAVVQKISQAVTTITTAVTQVASWVSATASTVGKSVSSAYSAIANTLGWNW